MKKHQKTRFWIFIWWLFLIFLSVIIGLQNFYQQKQDESYIQTEFFSNPGTIQTISSRQEEINEWYLTIPKIQVNQKIQEGTSQEVLKNAIGHFSETPLWEGNIGLAAHNRNGGKAGFFRDLSFLEQGDEITYTKDGESRTYEVVSNEIIAETDWSLLSSTEENRITLITCEEGMREYRRCVQACEKGGN